MKLSIITINYNNAEGLHKTLESVYSQTCCQFEHVIVDGGSSDGSVPIIKSYEESIVAKRLNQKTQYPIITWISEKDTGIYNAMNKGIKKAQGEYLLFLNSGDVFANDNVTSHFVDTDVKADIATGIEKMPNGDLIHPKKETELTYSFFYNDTLLHQSTFIRRDAFERYGMYREDYRIVSDWEWFFRAIIKEDATYQPLEFVVADFDGTGMSNDDKYRQLQNLEREKVHQEILPRIFNDYTELMRLRKIERESSYLEEGAFGWVIKLILWIKQIKKSLNK